MLEAPEVSGSRPHPFLSFPQEHESVAPAAFLLCIASTIRSATSFREIVYIGRAFSMDVGFPSHSSIWDIAPDTVGGRNVHIQSALKTMNARAGYGKTDAEADRAPRVYG